MLRNYLLCLFGIWAHFVGVTVGREAVLDGIIAEANQFPYQVSIQTPEKGHICGGSIIHALLILTAAHCVVTKHDTLRHNIFVIAGTNDLHKVQPPAVIVDVEEIFVAPEYKRSFINGTCDGDIAVLVMKHDLSLWPHGYLKKLHVPRIQKDYSGDDSVIAGFSYYYINNHLNFNHRLRFSTATVYPSDICKHFHPSINQNHLCARVHGLAGTRDRSTCIGDDGGPLVYNRSIVIGVLSRYPDDCREFFSLAIYTRVSTYMNFINNIISREDSHLKLA